jgi:hypothetical protein
MVTYQVYTDGSKTFSGVNFRNLSETEYESFYIRSHQSGNPDAAQYMPVYNGVPSWQLYSDSPYSAAVALPQSGWMDVKIVYQGEMAEVYFNHEPQASMTLPLVRTPAAGGISLWGLSFGHASRFKQFSYQATEGGGATAQVKPQSPQNTLAKWGISAPFAQAALDGALNLSAKNLPSTTPTAYLNADHRGIVNLGMHSAVKADADTVFASATVHSKSQQTKLLEFGFSDKVKIFVNGKLAYAGNDTYKSRDYRFLGTIGLYDEIPVSLVAGDNTIVFAVSENAADVTGWGLTARFKNSDGLQF